jgi:hypothetical protein
MECVIYLFTVFIFLFVLIIIFFINMDIQINLRVFLLIPTPEINELVILHSADCIPYFHGVAMPDLSIHISKFPC